MKYSMSKARSRQILYPGSIIPHHGKCAGLCSSCFHQPFHMTIIVIMTLTRSYITWFYAFPRKSYAPIIDLEHIQVVLVGYGIAGLNVAIGLSRRGTKFVRIKSRTLLEGIFANNKYHRLVTHDQGICQRWFALPRLTWRRIHLKYWRPYKM